jgi:shikimate dehydrogenase
VSGRPYAEVIGDPIAHSKSPLIHNFWLAKLGIDAEYRACHVRADELADYFARRRGDAEWRGCNVTMPHKEGVVPLCDTVSRQASRIQAVNCIYEQQGRFVGENTDVDGVAEAVGKAKLVGEEVCVIGAGGAARAVFQLMTEARAAAVLVMARDPDKALAVAKQFAIFAVGVPFTAQSAALSGASLLINATQLGMVHQEAMPDFILAELAELDPEAVVFDMVYAPLETPLLEAARRRGLQIVDGLTMLIGQAAAAFRLFFGRPAPREHDAELRALLTS